MSCIQLFIYLIRLWLISESKELNLQIKGFDGIDGATFMKINILKNKY